MTPSSSPRHLPTFLLTLLGACALSSHVQAQALTYGLADGSGSWDGATRDIIVQSMDEAVATYNRYGFFDKHLTANFNAGVPTAQASYSGWIDFGASRNTRVALHEVAHTLGIGQVWPFNGGAWAEDSAAGRLIKLYEGQAAVISTGGSHFWPYGLNFDNEDGPAARERHCKLVAALRFDMGVVQDSDGDGLPDDWESFHFGGLAESGEGDPDGDGISNTHEYATDADPTQPVPVQDGRTYVLRSQISQRALSVVAAAAPEGAGTEQREASGDPSQQWTARYLGDGFFSFTNLESGLVLEVPGSDTASGRPVQQAAWTGALQQQWRIVSGPGAEPDYHQIANRETARVVDGLDGAEGAPVQQWPFIGNIPQQFWSFEDVSPDVAEPDAGPDGASTDGGVASDGGLDVPDAQSGAAQDAASTPAPSDGAEQPASASCGSSDGGCTVSQRGVQQGSHGSLAFLALLGLALGRRRQRVLARLRRLA